MENILLFLMIYSITLIAMFGKDSNDSNLYEMIKTTLNIKNTKLLMIILVSPLVVIIVISLFIFAIVFMLIEGILSLFMKK